MWIGRPRSLGLLSGDARTFPNLIQRQSLSHLLASPLEGASLAWTCLSCPVPSIYLAQERICMVRVMASFNIVTAIDTLVQIMNLKSALSLPVTTWNCLQDISTLQSLSLLCSSSDCASRLSKLLPYKGQLSAILLSDERAWDQDQSCSVPKKALNPWRLFETWLQRRSDSSYITSESSRMAWRTPPRRGGGGGGPWVLPKDFHTRLCVGIIGRLEADLLEAKSLVKGV